MSATATAASPARSAAVRQKLAAFPAAVRGYRSTGRRYRRYIQPVRGRLALALAATVVHVLARLAEPWPVKLIIDGVFMAAPPPWLADLAPWFAPGSAALLVLLVATLPVIALVSALARYQQRIQATEAGLALGTNLRRAIFEHVQKLSSGFHARRRTGDLVTRIVSDVRILRDAFISTPVRTAEEVLLSAGMLAVMLMIDWKLSLVALALLPLLGVVFRRHERPMKKAARKQRARESVLATTASEALAALPAVQAFGRERSEVKRFGKAASKDLASGLLAARLEGRLMLISEAGIGIVGALIIGIAVLRIRAGEMTVGDLVVFAAYLTAFFQPIRRLARTMRRLQRAAAAGERIGEVLALEARIVERPDAVPAPAFRGAITLDHVSYTHQAGSPALSDVSLEIRPGERVALLGASGAGKTTLLSLLPRFIDPDEGVVRIDGVDIRTLRLDDLRRQIAVVFQEPLLLRTTVAENIAYGRAGASTDEVQRVAQRLGIAGMIEALPAGYDTRVGDRGGLLSGGQRQCVTIARAMMLDAPIVLLDEPLTGIDPAASAVVGEALRRLCEGRTVLMITHDMTALDPSDRVIWLADGRIAAEGSWRDFRGGLLQGPGSGGRGSGR